MKVNNTGISLLLLEPNLSNCIFFTLSYINIPPFNIKSCIGVVDLFIGSIGCKDCVRRDVVDPAGNFKTGPPLSIDPPVNPASVSPRDPPRGDGNVGEVAFGERS